MKPLSQFFQPMTLASLKTGKKESIYNTADCFCAIIEKNHAQNFFGYVCEREPVVYFSKEIMHL